MTDSNESASVTCTFCNIPSSSVVMKNKLAFVIFDRYPVSPGHALIIPKRHIESIFQATAEEILAIHSLSIRMYQYLMEHLDPHGFNMGVNIGQAGGQTVFHLHVHLIPRYRGDVADPRGGVRHVIPGKGIYPSLNNILNPNGSLE